MSSQLFARLSEEFDNHDGSLKGYVDLAGTPIAPRYHYNLRTFLNDDITVPRTMLDMRYNSVTDLDTSQMIVLDTPRIVTGRTIAARPVSLMNGQINTQLNTFTMHELEIYTLAAGGENWPTGDANVVYGKDSTERYANSMQITLTSGVTKIVTSAHYDDIQTDFESTSTYYIELALPGFPAQAAGTHLDLTNSFIDFSSDASGLFDVAQTDSFSFSNSLNSLTAGGDTYWRINRNSLVNTDLSSVTHVRFRLKSVGNMTLKMQALRLIKSDEYTFDEIDIDTRRSVLKRSIPEDSGTELSSPAQAAYIMKDTRPRNGSFSMKFNSGHAPVGNSNIFSLYTRVDTAAGTYIRVQLSSASTTTTIKLYEKTTGSETLLYTATLSALTNETDYVLIFDMKDNQIRASLYLASAAWLGSLTGTTDWRTTTQLGRGLIGFGFNPYNYDFSLDFITSSASEFGRFSSKTFSSITPVLGVTLSTETSLEVEIGQGHFIESGDATLTTDPQIGTPAPSLKFVRDGTLFQGGYMTDQYIFIGNPHYLRITGDIFPVLAPNESSVRGKFRVVFIDKNDSIGHMIYIRNLLPSQWNHFNLVMNIGAMAPGNYRIIIQQIGFFSDTFYIDNFSVGHPTLAWESSPDNGVTWYPLLTAIDSPYSGVNFTKPGRDLKVRATALSDTAWVSAYELIPLYRIPGQLVHALPSAMNTSSAWDVRTTAQGNAIPVTYTVKVSGRGVTSTITDARITGAHQTYQQIYDENLTYQNIYDEYPDYQGLN